MKTFVMFISIILLVSVAQANAQTQIPSLNPGVDYPEVPRVSAYEAYVKYKAGKAIIFHGGGDSFERRHILGAYNLDFKDRESILNKFPKKGIEIFTYCY